MLDRRLILSTVLTIPLLVVPIGCGGTEPALRDDPRSPVPIEVTQAETESHGGGLEVTATLLPLQRATPGTVLMGRVEAVLVHEGQRVHRGQLLARIESDDVTAGVAQAEAAVAAARAMEHNALLMRERMERLHGRQSASRRDLDDAIAAHDAATSQVRATEQAVKAAQVRLDHAEVTAPFAGVVTGKRVEAGDLATPGAPLFVIDDLSRVKVEGQVPESVGHALAVGDPVQVTVAGATHATRLHELVPAVDPHSRTWTVRALLDNPGGRLRSGMYARLALDGDTRSWVTVPDTARVTRGALNGVFVVESLEGSSVARLRWLTMGRSVDGRSEVLTGLAAGESIVVDPGPHLEDGQPVEVRK